MSVGDIGAAESRGPAASGGREAERAEKVGERGVTLRVGEVVEEDSLGGLATIELGISNPSATTKGKRTCQPLNVNEGAK